MDCIEWTQTLDTSICQSVCKYSSNTLLTRKRDHNSSREYALCTDSENILEDHLVEYDEHIEELVLVNRPCVLHFCLRRDSTCDNDVPCYVYDVIRRCQLLWDKTYPKEGTFEVADAAIFKCKPFYSIVVACAKFPKCLDMCTFLELVESQHMIRTYFTRSTYSGAYRWPLLNQSSSTTENTPLKPANRATRTYGATSSLVSLWFDFQP